MTLPDRMKFRVESPAHSEAIQKALFDGSALLRRNNQYLYASRLRCAIEMNNSSGMFNASESKECSLVKGQIVEGDHGPWDGFIPWFGGDCPVSSDLAVEAIFRDGGIPIESAKNFMWNHCDEEDDITAYRVVEEVCMKTVCDERCSYPMCMGVPPVDSEDTL